MKIINKKNYKTFLRLKRKVRIRKKIWGTAEKPRLTVFKSIKYTYIQAINDVKGHTITSCSVIDKTFSCENKKNKMDIAFIVGKNLGTKLIDIGIKKAVFDRNGYKYSNRIARIGDGIRESGIQM